MLGRQSRKERLTGSKKSSISRGQGLDSALGNAEPLVHCEQQPDLLTIICWTELLGEDGGKEAGQKAVTRTDLRCPRLFWLFYHEDMSVST